MERLFLIDAYALIFRSYYAFINRPMHNAQGVNTSAIFGFVKFVSELIRRESPHYLGVAFDPRGGNFRHELYPEYKANRSATPEEIIASVPYIKRLLDAMRIPILEVPGFEADDVIGTMAMKASEHGFEVFMVTPDKDFGQLIRPTVHIYKQRKGGEGIEVVGCDGIRTHYGIDDPRQVIDILALWGDASDNIPGVPGIGEKSAIKLVCEFGSVENLLLNTDRLKGKQRENIEARKDQIMLAKQLATIELNVPIDFEPDRLVMETPDLEQLASLYRELGFRSMLAELEGGQRGDFAYGFKGSRAGVGPGAVLGVTSGVGAQSRTGAGMPPSSLPKPPLRPEAPNLFSAFEAAEAAEAAEAVDASEAAAPRTSQTSPESVSSGSGSDLSRASSAQMPVLSSVSENSGANSSASAAHPGAESDSSSTLFDPPAYATIDTTPHEYHTVSTPIELAELCTLLRGVEAFCFDTETTGLDPFSDRLVGISVAICAHEAWYIPLDLQNTDDVAQALRPIFENPTIAKIGQNLKFDMLFLRSVGIKVAGLLYDTMLIHYLLDAESRHGMDHLSRTYLHYSPMPIESLIGKGPRQLTMDMVPVSRVTAYAAEDADITLQLKEYLWPLLEQAALSELYLTIEEPLISVLADVEAVGVHIDTEALAVSGRELTAELVGLEDKIREMTDDPNLNVNSPKQLGEVLFERLKIDPKPRRTKTKQYSTDEEYLQSLSDRHPVVGLILEYRGLRKLLSTYVEALPLLVNPRTGRIHTSFNQAVTATGRLSSTNPNLQNIPVREERGRDIRRAFIPSDSAHLLLSVDYSQVELRLMAHLSGDEAMIEAFSQGADIHTATAARLFGVPESEVTREQRRRAKTANFGIIYGISVFGLSQRLEISRGEAKEIIDGYFISYPGVRDYMTRVVEQAREVGYVTTLFGRKRFLPNIASSNAVVRGLSERNAINAPIQGGAADIMKLAMISVHRELLARGLQSKIILQVHDELVIDLLRSEEVQVRELVIRCMEDAVKLRVTLIAECGVGANWVEAH